ncbi:ATP-binding cassette domain-containing protein [bacterium]|nr:ATP-binding cassette domain-containing protein [bacterium]
MNPLFTLKNIRLSFSDTSIFSDFNFIIPDEKINVVMGSSGSGKSTLLRLLNRLIDPQDGQIFYKERSIAEIPVLELRHKVALMPQLKALPEETVNTFVLYGPTQHKKKIEESRLEALMQDVLLDPSILNKQIRDLSTGELQRVNLVRVILNDPEILLLDEPTANLDLDTTRKIESVLLDLIHKLNVRVVWVTHDAAQAQRLGVNPLFLKKGGI